MENRKSKIEHGFSLSELLVVISVIAVLIGIGVPTAKQISDSFESSAGVQNLISAALANARAIAVKEQKYAGLRFQQDLNSKQYMIFIIHDPADEMSIPEITAEPDLTGTGLADGFRAARGLKPIKLPVNTGLMDLRIRLNLSNPTDPSDTSIEVPGDDNASNANIDEYSEFNDTTTFSIIFSPSGKLLIHEVRIRNRHGKDYNDDASPDKIFNTYNNVDMGNTLFRQDDDAIIGLGQEHSRNSFVIYDKRDLAAIAADSMWTDYLSKLDVLYINPYTGEIVNK